MAFVSPSIEHDGLVPPHPLVNGRLRPGAIGHLYLNGDPVGTLTVTGWDTSWGFGRFRPEPAFVPFSTAFGLWSLLMHADGGRLSREASDELAQAENRLDRIRARIYFPVDGTWVDTFELNIDGELVEWKEY